MFGRFQRSRPTACDERSSAKAAEDRAQPKNAFLSCPRNRRPHEDKIAHM